MNKLPSGNRDDGVQHRLGNGQSGLDVESLKGGGGSEGMKGFLNVSPKSMAAFTRKKKEEKINSQP